MPPTDSGPNTSVARPGNDIWRFVEATELPDEATILARWDGKSDTPVLSILCNTFQHETYIEDALCGFLLQDTDFPFEILVHDDASPDGTQARIIAMAERYPAIIKPMFQNENQYSQGKRPWMFQEPRAKGEFVAFCEGNDFWTDPSKLQKQVNFLQANPSVSFTGHDSVILYPDGSTSDQGRCKSHRKDRDFTSEALVKNTAFISTLTICFRNYNLPFIFERTKVFNGDRFLFSLFGAHGSYHFHHDIDDGIYRHHDGGVWSSIGRKKRLDARRNLAFWLAAYYGRIGNDQMCEYFQSRFNKESWESGLVGGRIGKIGLNLQKAVRTVTRRLKPR